MKDFSYQDRIAVYPGSFDPITLGHIDIINRALKLFDKVIVLVLFNYRKKPLFSLDERVRLIKKATEGNEKIIVESFKGLLVDYLKQNNIRFVVKGMRAISDFEYEFQQHLVNSKLFDVETVFFMTKFEYNFLSSSLVKEIAYFGGDISPFVPSNILQDVLERMDKFKMEVD